MLDDNDPRFSRADSKSGQLQRLVYKHLVQEHAQKDLLPTSIRFVMYELEQLGLLSKEARAIQPGKKMARRPDQDLQEAITWLRDADIIPWDWIEDESRSIDEWNTAPTVLDYLRDRLKGASLDPWVGVPRPVIICESKAVGGILSRSIGGQYLCPIAPTGGMVRGFLINKVAPVLAERDSKVLYLGDKDDAGGDIEDHTRRVLERKIGETLKWRRIAITEEQADDLRRRGVRPIEKRDNRYRDGNPHQAFECEALGQGYLTDLVRVTLDAMLPKPLDAVLERERRERRQCERLFEAWRAMTAGQRAAFLRGVKA
jgi:hypothetical protein